MAEQVPLPKLTDGYLGKQSKFDEYGLTTLSHSDPVIYMAEDQSEVEIIIGTAESTRITTKLLSYERKQECNDFALVRCLGPSYCFLIRPPTPGFYKFQVYALPSGVAGPSFIGVFNYIIHCPKVPEQGVMALPKQYPMWKDGCYLTEPMGIPKGFRGTLPFRLNIPKAKDVQIKVGEDWNQLTLTDKDICTFEGDVDLGANDYPPGTKVKVNVKFQGNKFNTLLEYTL